MSEGVRVRREPPAFRQVAVRRVERITPRLVRVTLGGDELAGLTVEQPAASVRLLLPSPGEEDLVMPAWNGNEFLLADGRRPLIRTFTPVRAEPSRLELDVEIVDHGTGAASSWAVAAEPGHTAAVAGPGRGYVIDPATSAFVLAGDETALPAIIQLLDSMPAGPTITVHIEIARPEARLAMPGHPQATVHWWDLAEGAPPGDALLDAVTATAIEPGTRVWAAGEAAAMQRIRRHLFTDRGMARTAATVRGYWKHGRAGDDEEP